MRKDELTLEIKRLLSIYVFGLDGGGVLGARVLEPNYRGFIEIMFLLITKVNQETGSNIFDSIQVTNVIHDNIINRIDNLINLFIEYFLQKARTYYVSLQRIPGPYRDPNFINYIVIFDYIATNLPQPGLGKPALTSRTVVNDFMRDIDRVDYIHNYQHVQNDTRQIVTHYLNDLNSSYRRLWWNTMIYLRPDLRPNIIYQQRQEAERLAQIEAQRLEAERRAQIEAQRLEAERRAQIEAERLAQIEAQRVEAERRAQIETQRQRAQQFARSEADLLNQGNIRREIRSSGMAHEIHTAFRTIDQHNLVLTIQNFFREQGIPINHGLYNRFVESIPKDIKDTAENIINEHIEGGHEGASTETELKKFIYYVFYDIIRNDIEERNRIYQTNTLNDGIFPKIVIFEFNESNLTLKQTITAIMYYVLHQKSEFRKSYLENFSEQCSTAYPGERLRNRIACPKGVIEQIIMRLSDACTSYPEGSAKYIQSKCAEIISSLRPTTFYKNRYLQRQILHNLYNDMKRENLIREERAATGGASQEIIRRIVGHVTTQMIQERYKQKAKELFRERFPRISERERDDSINESVQYFSEEDPYTNYFEPENFIENFYMEPTLEGGVRKFTKKKYHKLQTRRGKRHAVKKTRGKKIHGRKKTRGKK
jgi:hypothetical protein